VQGFRFCNAAAAAYLSIVRVFCEREGTFFFFDEKRSVFFTTMVKSTKRKKTFFFSP
jgi:hypothetical protein